MLLSEIYLSECDNLNNFLVLDCGDLFKGIYDKNLSVNAYLKLKKLLPNAEIFFTLGNNDFGFKKEDFEFLKDTIAKFKDAGIRVVCANLVDAKTCKPLDFVPRFEIVSINGVRILITGLCVNNSCAKKFGCELLSPNESFVELINSVKQEYDKIIVLNHHWYPYSKSLKEFATAKGINIDLIIGGHEHSPIIPDYENSIFYPLAFARTLFKMKLEDSIKDIQELPLSELRFIPEFEKPILEYEKQTELKKTIAKRVLNLTKKYSEPCPLGTFISDAMRDVAGTDIAFHSTGFTMYPLKLDESDVVTSYDLQKVMCATSVIQKIEINVEQLKQVFENATVNRMLKTQGNSRFVQCSQNIEVVGVGNFEDKTYKILQISIDGEKLLDENQRPIDKSKVFTCTIDPYIGSGEQGFEVLKNIPKTNVIFNGKDARINEVFTWAIKNAPSKFYNNSEYPSFKFIDL